MPKRMLVHDSRLAGSAPHIAENIYIVNGSVESSNVVGWIAQHARNVGGLDELIIMCHGFVTFESDARQMTTNEPAGGSGLQLGKQGLTLWNVSTTASWKGLIGTIFVYSCGAGAGNAQPLFDGRRFCGELAIHSGAGVYASDKLQWYTRSFWRDRIDFGEWEGQVRRYSPVSGQGTPVTLGAQPT